MPDVSEFSGLFCSQKGKDWKWGYALNQIFVIGMH